MMLGSGELLQNSQNFVHTLILNVKNKKGVEIFPTPIY